MTQILLEPGCTAFIHDEDDNLVTTIYAPFPDGARTADCGEQGPKMTLAEMARYYNTPNDILDDVDFTSVDDGDYGTTDGNIRRAPDEPEPYPFDAERAYMAFVEDALERIGSELRGTFYEMTYDQRRNAARVIENGRALVLVEVGEKAD